MESVRAGSLGVSVVRSVIGRDRIDHALGQRLSQRVTIVDRSQRRVHAAVRAQGHDVRRRQREVVGRRLRRHPQRVPFRGPDQIDAGTGTDVLNVEARTGDRLQRLERLFHRGGLGFGAISKPLDLCMDKQRHPGLGRRLERAPKGGLVHQVTAVVGEGDRTSPAERRRVRQGSAFEPHRDGAHEAHADRKVHRPRHQRAHQGGPVGNRARVRHSHDVRESAESGACGA